MRRWDRGACEAAVRDICTSASPPDDETQVARSEPSVPRELDERGRAASAAAPTDVT